MKLRTFPLNNEKRLYSDLAWTWPIISPLEHYIEETEFFSNVIREHSKIPVKTLLHLGCGGGHNDYTLKKYFQVTGVDVSPEILKLAKKLNPEVNYICEDMRTVQLGHSFDAVVAIDSIAYILTVEDLRKVFTIAFSHLKPGGIFMFIAEDTKEDFKQNNTTSYTNSQGEIEITFIDNRYDPDETDTTYESTFIYLVRRKGNLEIHTDRHLCGLFKLDILADLLKEIGFEVKQLKYEPPKSAVEPSGLAGYKNYPMFVCIKP
ncbi:MAG: class I SAM-dependent methyltransferase [Candidatus Edwardsbacteria bacterium]